MQRDAAKKASKLKKTPFMVWPEDLEDWLNTIKEGRFPSLPFPFIGDYVPKGYKEVSTYFVDSSGFGLESEPALTIPSFVRKIRSGYAYAITEVGQFQLYITEFEKES
jgi:hypothetical protein